MSLSSPRIAVAGLGAVLVIVSATLGLGWAILTIAGALIGYYLGAALEGDVDLSTLLAPLRQRRY